MFAEGVKGLLDGRFSLTAGGDTIKCALMKQSFVGTTFTETVRDTYNFFASIPDADIAKNTFKAIGTSGSVIDTTADDVNFASATVSVTFGSVTDTTVVGGIVVFRSATTEGASDLICFNKFASTTTADGGTVTVTLNADGLFQASFD
jgi:hypothetical protein